MAFPRMTFPVHASAIAPATPPHSLMRSPFSLGPALQCAVSNVSGCLSAAGCSFTDHYLPRSPKPQVVLLGTAVSAAGP